MKSNPAGRASPPIHPLACPLSRPIAILRDSVALRCVSSVLKAASSDVHRDRLPSQIPPRLSASSRIRFGRLVTLFARSGRGRTERAYR